MFAHCFRSTYQRALATSALGLAACVSITLDAARVSNDARQWTLRVHDSSDPKAQACYQAATAAAAAATNVQGPQSRGQAVSEERWAALKYADRDMQSACSEIPK
jgi:hypothetical protein